MNKISTTLEANIDKLEDEDSDLTSYDSKESIWNSNFQFNN